MLASTIARALTDVRAFWPNGAIFVASYVLASPVLANQTLSTHLGAALILSGICHAAGLTQWLFEELPKPIDYQAKALPDLSHLPTEILRRWPHKRFKRVATVAITNYEALERTSYKILLDEAPVGWTSDGPTFRTLLIRGRDDKVWEYTATFKGCRTSFRFSRIDPDAPTVVIDLRQPELYIRQSSFGDRDRARRDAHRAQNPYLKPALEMVAASADTVRDRASLGRLRRQVAKEFHPDSGHPGDVELRTRALAAANEQIEHLRERLGIT
jgi:hypothetical protein